MRSKIRRVRAWPIPQQASQGGIVLPYALFVTVLVLILGLAFMQTSTSESLANTRAVQRLQANAAAEYGIARARAMADSQFGVWCSMTYNGAALTWNTSSSYGGNYICTLFSNQAVPSTPAATYTVVIEDTTGWMPTSSTSIYRIHGYGTVGNYTRHVSLDSQALNYASFGWLTNSENGVWFRTGDKLSGLIWSNDQFNITGNPTFNGHVYTGSGSIDYANGGPPNDNPTFAQGITYNAPHLNISSVMNSGQITRIQTAANSAGISELSNSGHGYSLTFNSGGTFTLNKLDSSGNKVTPALYSNAAISTYNGAFYFQDKVQVSGVVQGQVTLATSSGNDIQIVGNLSYSYPSNVATMFQAGFNASDPLLVDKCALVSGGDVVVDQTWSGGWTDMYVTASCASVTGSFRNEYYTSSPQKTLHVYGGVAQMTRGAVGQVSGNGFLKDYVYDTRFSTSPPPFLPWIGARFINWQLY
jgi:hypothetical protein